MNTTARTNSRNTRGSALIVVLIFTLVLLVLSGSIVSLSLSERRFNSRNASWLEARNAAEAVAEYGCYQVAQAYNTRLSPTFGATGTNPVSFPTSLGTSYFGSSNVDLTQDTYHNLVNITLAAGNVTFVPSTGYNYVDPNDPNNKYDPLKGRYVTRRDVTILAKATVNPPSGGNPITAYVEEKVTVRGAPLLAYAIFYSGNDLEFNETPQMDIYGAVHVNGNLFIGPAGSSPSPLSFHGPVTASGNVYHAWRGTTATAQENTTMSSTTAVNFSTDGVGATAGTLFNMRTSTGVWKDSTMGADSATSGLANLQAQVTPSVSASFSQYASQNWHGNLQTAAMGIQSYNPMGFTEIVGHTTANGDIYATDPLADLNANVGTSGGYSSSTQTGYGNGYGPHALIEPPLTVPSTDTYAAAKTSIEQSKFARKAGLYIKVTVKRPTSGVGPDIIDTANTAIYGDPNSAPTGTPSSNIGTNGGLRLTTTLPTNVVSYIGYNTASGNVSAGMYDQRQSTGVNLVQIDMKALTTAVTNMATAGTGNATTDFVNSSTGNRWGLGTANSGYDPNIANSTGWNGGLYIEIEQTGASNQTAVMLANGKVTAGQSLVPPATSAPNKVDGLTIATNAPVYILGHLNADPSSGTANAAQYPDDYPGKTPKNSAESPLCVASDATTVLSPNYFGTGAASNVVAPSSNTSGTSAYKSVSTSAPNASSSVEIAAALITGTVTTSPDSTGTQQYSGGVHNLPRFLENWGSNTVYIRGSMVSMYNSRVATARWQQFYYSAPGRQWGYDALFASGRYPPIVPQVISYRRVDFTYLKNASDFAAELSKL